MAGIAAQIQERQNSNGWAIRNCQAGFIRLDGTCFFCCIEFTHGAHEPVALSRDRANQALFVPAAEQVAGELEAGVVTFTESAWLREHMVNAKLAPGKYGVSVRKENRSSRHKIDLAVCLIGGRMLRRIYLLSTKQGTPGKGRAILLD